MTNIIDAEKASKSNIIWYLGSSCLVLNCLSFFFFFLNSLHLSCYIYIFMTMISECASPKRKRKTTRMMTDCERTPSWHCLWPLQVPWEHSLVPGDLRSSLTHAFHESVSFPFKLCVIIVHTTIEDEKNMRKNNCTRRLVRRYQNKNWSISHKVRKKFKTGTRNGAFPPRHPHTHDEYQPYSPNLTCSAQNSWQCFVWHSIMH